MAKTATRKQPPCQQFYFAGISIANYDLTNSEQTNSDSGTKFAMIEERWLNVDATFGDELPPTFDGRHLQLERIAIGMQNDKTEDASFQK